MKVLVFDDNKTNREAAMAQLGRDHDLTVVGTYDEAQSLLTPKIDYNRAWSRTKERFGDHPGEDEAKKKAYHKVREEEEEAATTYPDFDVVLTDLLVPASGQSQGYGGRLLVGEEMPVGVFIGLLAAIKGKAKYVAFTDTDHHSHPASACFDVFNAGETSPTAFTVNGCKMLLSNTRNWVGYFDPSNMKTEVEVYKDLPSNVSPAQREREWLEEGKITRAKNWAILLEYLLNS